MEAVLSQNFSERYQSTTESIYDELKSRLNGVTLESMKAFLREKNIDFDDSSTDLKEFKKNVVSKLDVSVKKELTTLEENLNKDLTEVIEALHAGSQTSFSKFAEKAGIIGKSSLKAMARITATKTAYALGGPIFGTAVNAGAIIVPAVVKCVKEAKKFSQDTKDAAIDTVLLKLTTEKNSEGKLTCKIPEQIRANIADIFLEEGIKLNTENSVLFFKDAMQLDNSQKERIANMINDGLGKKLDIENEKKQIEVNLNQMSKQLKKEITSTISTAAILGMNVGTTLSQWDAATSASIMTGLTTGAVTGKGWAGFAVGGVQWIASKFGGWIPVIGDAIEDGLEKVNTELVLGGAIGTAVTGALLFKTGKMAFKAAIGTLKRMRQIKEVKERKNDIDKNIETALKETQEAIDNKTNKDIMMEIVVDTLKSKGVSINEKIHTASQLKEYISGLDADSKAEVAEVTQLLEKVGNENEKNVKKVLKDIAKTAYWGGIITLAGLGAYDALINPGFIEALVEKNEIIQEAEALGMTTDELIDHKVEVAHIDANAQIDEFKDYLPQDGYDYLNVEKFPFDPNTVREVEASEIRPMLEQLNLVNSNGIVNKAVLENVLNNADPELLDIVKKSFGMDTIEEIASSVQAQEYFRGVGRYPMPEGHEELLDGIFGTNYTTFGDILNEYFTKTLENIPTQGATNEEIMKFMQSLSEDEIKADAFKTFVLQNGKNTGDFEAFIEGIGATFTTSGRENAIEEVVTKIDTYTELDSTKEGIKAAVKTKLPSDPKKIIGIGAAIGAGITAIANFGKKLINGELFQRKPKALPPGNAEKISEENVFDKRLHTETPKIIQSINTNEANINDKVSETERDD